DFLLETDQPLTDIAEFYIPDDNGKFSKKVSGDHLPFHKRGFDHRNIIFKVMQKPGEHTYFLRIESNDAVSFNISILSSDGLYERARNNLPVYWFYYGILAIMIFYNLFIFISARERAYIFLVLFILSIMLFDLSMRGFSYQLLWPNSSYWADRATLFFENQFMLWLALFVRDFVNSPTKFPITNKLLIYMNIIPFIISSILSLIAPLHLGIASCYISITISMIILGVVGIYLSFFKGSREALICILAFAPLIFFGTVITLWAMGVLPTTFITKFALQFGIGLTVALLSFGLADKINVMRKDLQVLNENLEEKVKYRTNELQASMEDMADMNEQLVETRDALWGEMEIAKKIQSVLLPEKPQIPGYEISAYMNPADEVGGDYYDVINSSGRDWIVIGDVSGHGVPAGLVMMMAQTSINTVLTFKPDIPASELLIAINKTIEKNIKNLGDDKYMTMTVLAVHEAGSFQFSGLHQDLLVYRAGTGKVEEVETRGMWIGIVNDIEGMVMDDTLSLNVGDAVLLYTDGITEATRKDIILEPGKNGDNMFGDGRLVDIFTGLGSGMPDEVKDGILKELEGYDCGDDVTMVVFKRV
ncbi:MAG: SpoIIE family protein phosphatase, partial [bacterium]|nr:SpoIIE family protein phosphatase [bacterium]